ncbi:MAG: DUF72 domain-containing protein [Candidatus Hodarchaeota archaeon]
MTIRKLLLGTSGWGYPEWRGPFYPHNLRQELFLSFYSEIFPVVEINMSFYRMPSVKMVKRWDQSTQADFLFAAKIPRVITHDSKLQGNDWQGKLTTYLEIMDRLGKKLGPSLLQLPPSFTAKEIAHLEAFLAEWPARLKVAVEFRHKSWLADGESSPVFSLLDKYDAAYCIVSEPLLPPLLGPTTAEFSYVRWHGFGKKIWYDYDYSEEEIAQWVPKINELSSTNQVFGFFNNHYRGNAVKNCQTMQEMLGEQPTHPHEVDYQAVLRKAGRKQPKTKTLEAWLPK